MTYNEFIDKIINERGRFNCGNEYHERHHIIPKCLGGTNNKDNLIDLYAKEHFEAHRLLSLENPQIKGLVYAWHRMSNGGNKNMDSYKLTQEEYEEMKKVYSEMRRKEATGVKQSAETIEKRVSKLRGKARSEEVKEAVRKAQKGRKVSEETKQKISDSLTGRQSALKGKKMSEKGRLSLCKYVYYCPELNESFFSSKEIQDKYGISSQNIIRCVNGGTKTCGKHPLTHEKLHWTRKNKEVN